MKMLRIRKNYPLFALIKIDQNRRQKNVTFNPRVQAILLISVNASINYLWYVNWLHFSP